MRLTKNCLIQKSYSFIKGGKVWRVSFLHVLRGFEISKDIVINFQFILFQLYHIFFLRRKSKEYEIPSKNVLVLNLMVKEIFYHNLSRG